jgi:hypothetical protein
MVVIAESRYGDENAARQLLSLRQLLRATYIRLGSEG